MNPIAGRISDRSTSPKGRRRPFVLWGGLALAVAFAAIFAGPTTPRGLAVAWVLVTFIAGATAYSFFQVPFIAMAAGDDPTYAGHPPDDLACHHPQRLRSLLTGGTAR